MQAHILIYTNACICLQNYKYTYVCTYLRMYVYILCYVMLCMYVLCTYVLGLEKNGWDQLNMHLFITKPTHVHIYVHTLSEMLYKYLISNYSHSCSGPLRPVASSTSNILSSDAILNVITHDFHWFQIIHKVVSVMLKTSSTVIIIYI